MPPFRCCNRLPPARRARLFGSYNCYVKSYVEIGESARKHGIIDADIEHAMENAMAFEHQDDGRLLYLGPSRSGAPLEVIKVVGPELVIHAMSARHKHVRLLSGCRASR